ncbi:MAG: hypothetical protein GWN58_09670 [Anaerolineae bacterium]|nr:hypothetical protein [Anaerolineae bacterium]
MIEYLSFGAGPPSLALAILNATGRVQPRARLVVFADTGWEKARTYELLPIYRDWLAEFDLELVTVQAKAGPLPDYIRSRSVPIPVHTIKGMGKRQCTDKWKIEPIERYLHGRFGNVGLVAQLGMTTDEWHRIRDPRVKRNRNRWPLLELGINRAETVQIIREAGLPVPPWSACLGCPLQNDGRWRVLASEHPEAFAEAVDMDEFLRDRAARAGRGDLWLHYSRRPLRKLYSSDQRPLGLDVDPTGGACESGHCFT